MNLIRHRACLETATKNPSDLRRTSSLEALPGDVKQSVIKVVAYERAVNLSLSDRMSAARHHQGPDATVQVGARAWRESGLFFWLILLIDMTVRQNPEAFSLLERTL